MTYLPNLIKRIENFYRQATAFGLLTKGQQDYSQYEDFDDPEPEPDYSQYDDPRFQKVEKPNIPEAPEPIGGGYESGESEEDEGSEEGDPIYNRVVESLEYFNNDEIKEIVSVVADTYLGAVRINGGFPSILNEVEKAQKSLNNVSKTYGLFVSPEVFMAKGLLNQIKEGAKQLAINNPIIQMDDPTAAKKLREVKQEAIANFSRQEMAEQKIKFERGDKTGLISGTAGSIDTGIRGRKKYENDNIILRKGLEDSSVSENDKQYIPILINMNQQILNQMSDFNVVKQRLATIPNDIEAQRDAKKEEDRLLELIDKRATIQLALKKFSLNNKKQELINAAVSAKTKDEKSWWAWKAHIVNIRLTDNLNKMPAIQVANEIVAKLGKMQNANGRTEFISNNLPPQMQLDLIKKFDLAAKEMITKEEYDRKLTLERGKQQARLITPSYEAERGGARVQNKFLPEEERVDYDKVSFSAKIKKLQDDVASAVQAARQVIYETKIGKSKTINEVGKYYKSIIDEISGAIRKKDRPALYDAQKRLVAAINSNMNVKIKFVRGYIEVIRLEPHFRKVLETTRELIKEKKNEPPKLDDSGNLIATNFSDEDKNTLVYILNDIDRLKTRYNQSYQNISDMAKRRENKPNEWKNIEWWETKQNIEARFKYVLEDLNKIQVAIELSLHLRKPEQKQLYPKRSPLLKEIGIEQKKKQEEEWKRKTPQERLRHEMKRKELQEKFQEKISAITYRMSLLKIAQEVEATKEIDQATADRLANEIFDKIYNDAFQKMLSEVQI